VLTDTDFEKIIESARHSLLRLETLDRYQGSIDGSDLSVYLAGGEQLHTPEKLAWKVPPGGASRWYLATQGAPDRHHRRTERPSALRVRVELHRDHCRR
jgi:hypothetical protein